MNFKTQMCSMFLPVSIQEAPPEYSFTQSYTVLAPADRLQAPGEVHALGPAEEGRGFVSFRHGAMRGNAEKLVGQVARFIYKPNSMTSVLVYPSPPCRA
jgi:hypothetical protein